MSDTPVKMWDITDTTQLSGMLCYGTKKEAPPQPAGIATEHEAAEESELAPPQRIKVKF
jgi:hypothetical protein